MVPVSFDRLGAMAVDVAAAIVGLLWAAASVRAPGAERWWTGYLFDSGQGIEGKC